jgi:tRNA guanosine-2'-O-methyltransferase
VLGAERTGMPADVLVECDECVEIRQWGSTRSMNVQTAAATVLYEWRRQWGDGRQTLE